MRIRKDDIYNSILCAARNEFIRRGFKDASMRDVARKADVGLSNIYNYFKNKDEIFLAVVKPARDQLFEFITEHHTERHIDFERMSTLTYQEKTIGTYIRLLEEYKAELRLLLYNSEGSSMANFRDDFTGHITQVSNNHMDILKKHYPGIREVSPFFIHALCAFMVSIVGEIITHDLSRKKIREFFKEYFEFQFAGWRTLTGI